MDVLSCVFHLSELQTSQNSKEILQRIGTFIIFFMDCIHSVSSLTPKASNIDNNCPDAAEMDVKNRLEIICAFLKGQCEMSKPFITGSVIRQKNIKEI